MLEIYNGREKFYQWDTNQKVIVDDNEVIVVQFDNGTGDALVCGVYEYEGKRVADVPNTMLQSDWNIKVYAACAECVRYARVYEVERRNRPDDYVYTETETLKYSTLFDALTEVEDVVDQHESRITELEQRPTGGGSSTGSDKFITGTKESGSQTLTFSMSGEEMYKLGYGLLDYDVWFIESTVKYNLAYITGYSSKKMNAFFISTQEDRVETYYIEIYADGTIQTNANNPGVQSRLIRDMPAPITAGDTTVKYLASTNGKYQLVDAPTSETPMLMGYEVSGQIVLENAITIPELLEAYGETGTFQLKLITMNPDTYEIKGYSLSYLLLDQEDTAAWYILFADGRGTVIKMDAVGTFSYVESNYYTRDEVDTAITTAIASITDGEAVSY